MEIDTTYLTQPETHMNKFGWIGILATAAALACMPALAKTVLIDVRTSAEYAQDHIEGALNIDHTTIGKNISSANVAKDDTVLLYCRSGSRSGFALETLKSLGYTRVENYGGIAEARKRLHQN